MNRKVLKLVPIICLPFLAAGVLFYISQRQKNEPLVVWTDQQTLVSYAELFNASQSRYKVVVKYQPSPVEAFYSAEGGKPDVVVGPWLKNESVRKNFLPLDYLFDDKKLDRKDFYPQLLALGNINEKQFLLPVSFNLPLIAFSESNGGYVEENFMLSLDQIRDAGKTFNEKNKSGDFTAMGFAPVWNSDFLYAVSKLFNADYTEDETLFSYDRRAVEQAIEYLHGWTNEANGSAKAESDFQFKYLMYPVYKLVNSGRCLFAYSKTDELFALPQDRLQNIDFRWIHKDNRIAMADKLIYLGICRKCRNLECAQAFVLWLESELTQRDLLERMSKMKLNTKAFGIAGGFSSIKSVNERFFPLYYPILYGHLPAAEYLYPPNILPAQWEEIKKDILIPFFEESVRQSETLKVRSIDERIQEWNKRSY